MMPGKKKSKIDLTVLASVKSGPKMPKVPPGMGSSAGMPKGFEGSEFDKDTKKAPEGSKADKARDMKQSKAFMKAKKGGK